MQEPGHPAPTSGAPFRSAALVAVAAASSSQRLGCTEGEPSKFRHKQCIVALVFQGRRVGMCSNVSRDRQSLLKRQLSYSSGRPQVEQPGSAMSGGSGEGTPAPSSLWQRGSQWLWASMSLDLTSRPVSTRVAAPAVAGCRHWRRTPPPPCILGILAFLGGRICVSGCFHVAHAGS